MFELRILRQARYEEQEELVSTMNVDVDADIFLQPQLRLRADLRPTQNIYCHQSHLKVYQGHIKGPVYFVAHPLPGDIMRWVWRWVNFFFVWKVEMREVFTSDGVFVKVKTFQLQPLVKIPVSRIARHALTSYLHHAEDAQEQLHGDETS